MSRQAARLRSHLAAETRGANGIGSLGRLIGYLRDAAARPRPRRRRPADRAGGAAHRKPPAGAVRRVAAGGRPERGARAVVWNTAGLELPTVGEEYVAHLHDRTTPRQRAGAAVYGLAADLAQSIFFTRPDRPDVLVVEEAAPLTNSPGGQKCCNRIIRQGRKIPDRVRRHQPAPDQGLRGARGRVHRPAAVSGVQGLPAGPGHAGSGAGATWTATRSCCATTWRTPARSRLSTTATTAIEHRYGTVIPGREGEAWFLDEFGGFGKVGLFAAPTAALAAALDTNPRRWTRTP